MDVSQKRFLAALAALLAKMANADGVVSLDERGKVQSIWRKLGLTAEQSEYCSLSFNLAQNDGIPFRRYIQEFVATRFGVDAREFLYGLLWDVACADGVLHKNEKEILERLPDELGLPPDSYDAYYARYIKNERTAVDAELEEMAKAARQKAEEERRKAEELRQRKQKVQKEVTNLTSAAEELLLNSTESIAYSYSSTTITKRDLSIHELLRMGLELQRLREEMLDCGWIRDSDEFVLVEELLLKCYKRAGRHPRDYFSKKGKLSANEAEASYRLSLLYLPHQYRELIREEDKVTTLSEKYGVATNFLNDAAENDNYNAIKLAIDIDLKQRREKKNKGNYNQELEAQLTQNKKRLAQHPDATSDDIYLYAYWISETRPSESLEYLKKAAEMGDENAKKDLLELRKEALAKGNTLEE